MLASASDYIFTQGAAASVINGGNSNAQVMGMTLEHWLWMYECYRTLKYQGSMTCGPYRASYTGSSQSENPGCMTPNRNTIKTWKSELDAILTLSRPKDVKGYDTLGRKIWTWYKSVSQEDTSNANTPGITNAQIEPYISYGAQSALSLTESMSPSLSVVTSMFGYGSGKVGSECMNPQFFSACYYAGGFTGGSVITTRGPAYELGNMGCFFDGWYESWKRNGSNNARPEDDNDLEIMPFLMSYATSSPRRVAVHYFRHVTDASDFVYTRDMNISYFLPNHPWASAFMDPCISALPVFSLVVVPLWKDDTGHYAYDKKRSWCFLPGGWIGNYAQGGRNWKGVFDSLTYINEVIKIAKNGGFNPANIEGTSPQHEETGSGWTKVGYQLYAYPTGIVAHTNAAARLMGV